MEKQKVVRRNAKREKKNKRSYSWSVTQLKTLTSYKKRTMNTWQQPKTKAEHIDKWNELKNREKPPSSPVQEEQDDDDEEEEVIVALASV